MPYEKLVPLEKSDDKSIEVEKKQTARNYTLYKLHELISDGVTSDNEPWISRLLDNFLGELGDNGYKVHDLPIVAQVLEFFAWKAKDVEKYETHLEKLLELCELPPSLHDSWGSSGSTILLEQYFTTLGHLMTVLPNEREIMKVVKAIDGLLVRLDERTDAFTVKAELCFLAIEKSRLPIVAVQLVEISSEVMYLQILELVFFLVANSHICCYRMLEAKVLDHLLIRMDLRDINERSLQDGACWKKGTIITTNIVMVLMRSIVSPGEFIAHLRTPPEPSVEATRSLRNVLRREVCESSQCGGNNIVLRNDVASMILAMLAALPSWQFLISGLAEDLVLLSVATESGASGTWAEDVKFRRNNDDDLSFKKIMLSILCQLCIRGGGAVVAIMEERRVMVGILELINPAIVECCSLSELAMRILAHLVPKMPREFTLHKGATKLIRMITQSSDFNVKFDSHVVMELTKSVCRIITQKCCPLVLESFNKAGIFGSLFGLVNRILTFDRLTMQHQRILTLLIATIEGITKTNQELKRPTEKTRHDSIVKMLTKLLERCSYQRKNDFQLDQRLLIAIGSCIWECIIRSIESTEEFVKIGGIYMMLDLIENETIFPVRRIYLGILTDMCSVGYEVVSQLCTWRGLHKTNGFMTLLAKSWREEEIRTGVKRTPEGFIDDTELPIMGAEQWIKTFHAKAAFDSSPALGSILGSMRPNIYRMRKLIIPYQTSNERYKIFLKNTQWKECTTMIIADQLYRLSQGQVWSEVSRYLEQRGVNLLGVDGEIMILMNERHSAWAAYVRGHQDTLLRAKREEQAEGERKEMARIRDSKLGSSLEALRKIDYIRTTTERNYAIQKKSLDAQYSRERKS